MCCYGNQAVVPTASLMDGFQGHLCVRVCVCVIWWVTLERGPWGFKIRMGGPGRERGYQKPPSSDLLPVSDLLLLPVSPPRAPPCCCHSPFPPIPFWMSPSWSWLTSAWPSLSGKATAALTLCPRPCRGPSLLTSPWALGWVALADSALSLSCLFDGAGPVFPAVHEVTAAAGHGHGQVQCPVLRCSWTHSEPVLGGPLAPLLPPGVPRQPWGRGPG